MLFFSIEQAVIRRNVNSSKQALAEQSTIEANNAELESAKSELQTEENEYGTGIPGALLPVPPLVSCVG